ncbi:hypothetical protein [Ectopseudomonas khazarica]|uniref:hypothetical protein n=1 Tax=Ectopseudomonas khazarica TaxID=2502979 RepID=UPI00106E1A3B|nr:hypothetical protein [Pseudomonas khazarica]
MDALSYVLDVLCTFLNTLLSLLLSTELISAFLGAILGGWFTLRATNSAHKLAAEAVLAADKAVLYDTTRLIQVEITTALKVYQEEYGDELMTLPEDTPYVCIFPIGANPFPIYDSAPACLSQLPAELSELLVRIYMRAKGLITMIEMNNRDTEKAQELAQTLLNDRIASLGHVLTPEASERVSQLYQDDVLSRATVLGMGSTADGMKSVTEEIVELMNKANELIAKLPKPTGR